MRPILAHPERVMEFQDNFARIEELVEAGALVQITAAHLIGWGGRKLRRCCERMLKAGLVHFVASDSHFGDRRLLAMVPAWQRLVRIGGQETAARLMMENQLAVLEGGFVQASGPLK
jgi:protein-tyrosine phosphatase